MNVNKSKKYSFLLILFFLLLMGICLAYIKAQEALENGARVQPQSELYYYLDVYYDGVDKFGNQSSDSNLAEINSNEITIEDKLPDGLEFKGFIETTDGTIGAVKRSDNSSCLGYVVDGISGLKYNESTGTISFKVRNLQAGCKITVGIKTMTPTIDDPRTEEIEKRRDFYNTATGIEDGYVISSNTVHVWMGQEAASLYTVTYQYEGDVPEGAPQVYPASEYSANSIVNVAPSVNVEGYNFSGWETSDVEVINGKFTVPEKNVTFTGSFTEKPKYEVNYSINGDMPNEYIVPSTKQYYEDSHIKVDSLSVGDVINGYRFLGWHTEDVVIDSNNYFEMPNKNVNIVGSFELIKYSVTYAFQGNVIPPNSETLLPATKKYAPGENVKLEEVDSIAGYEFLGWYSENDFVMPEEDVVIYGEWKAILGYFSPSITKEIINQKDYYRPGDIVESLITITNNEDYPIRNVVVRENNEKVYFEKIDDYSLINDRVVEIPMIAANSQVTLKSYYKVTTEDKFSVKNEVELIAASAENYRELDKTKEYKAHVTFNIQVVLTISKTVTNNSKTDKVFQFHIENKEKNYDTWIYLKNNETKKIYIDPGNYQVTEVVPQDYEFESAIVNSNGKVSEKKENIIFINITDNYDIVFNNSYKKKSFYHSSGRAENKILSLINSITSSFKKKDPSN